MLLITQRNDLNKNGDLVDSLENSYIEYFEKLGAELVIIPNTSKQIESYFELMPEGIILSGGNTINPKLYGSSLQEQSVSIERDATEKKILEIAVTKRIPVLGICRGMQFINVFFGGKLENIKDSVARALNHSPQGGISAIHKIKFSVPDFGKEAEVNSYHNFGVTKNAVSSELKVFAESSDGVIEGIYHPKLPIAGIEWHPERKSPDTSVNEKIIKAFLSKRVFWK